MSPPVNLELKEAREKADALGIEYHHKNNAGTIYEKIGMYFASQSSPAAIAEDPIDPPQPEALPEGAVLEEKESLPAPDARDVTVLSYSEWKEEDAKHRHRKAGTLVRITATCMNPQKSEWDGEMFSVGSRKVGTFKKFVPFGVEWHVPQMILDMMEDRQYSQFYNVPDGMGGTIRKSRLVKEFSIHVHPQMTPEQLQALGRQQALARGQAA